MANSISGAILKYKESLNTSLDNSVVIEDVIDSEVALTPSPEIIFKVQIAAGSRRLETKSYNFKGLKGIAIEKIGNGYKYFYGETSNYAKIKEQRVEARKKGYSSCFIVAFKDGEKISIKEALKTFSN